MAPGNPFPGEFPPGLGEAIDDRPSAVGHDIQRATAIGKQISVRHFPRIRSIFLEPISRFWGRKWLPCRHICIVLRIVEDAGAHPLEIAIDAMPYCVYKHAIRNERRGCAAAAGARALFQPRQ
jgi:hypothetical protein